MGLSLRNVSIPFIAGQWSLLLAGGGRMRPAPEGLNPLHCGAVVASPRRGAPGGAAEPPVSIPFIAGQWSLPPRPAAGRGGRRRGVSIPFIAGQWSLLVVAAVARKEAAASQSPSLRGSGRFSAPRRKRSRRRWCLNPLHCGAVVASRRRRAAAASPPVSIPFIAGQWSLHCYGHVATEYGAGLNPLHCGAVVASRRLGS